MKIIITLITSTLFLYSAIYSFGQKDVLLQQLEEASKEEKLSIYSQLVDLSFEEAKDECIGYAKELEKLSKKFNNENEEVKAYKILASIYFEKKDIKNASKYFEKELVLREQQGASKKLAESYFNLAASYMLIPNDRKAKKSYEKSLELAHQIDYIPLIIANQKALITVYSNLGLYQDALNSLKAYVENHEGEFNEGIALFSEKVAQYKNKYYQEKKIKETKISELNETKEDLELKEVQVEALEEDTTQKSQQIEQLNYEQMLQELQMEKKENELKQQRKLTYTFIGGFIIILGFAFFLFRLYRLNKKMNTKLLYQQKEILDKNEELNQQNEEIITQRDEIERHKDILEKKNELITNSIVYASKIQSALLPIEECFEKAFSDHLLFYKPRDIVSGDFYFLQNINEYTVFAAVDCTGHGVPGAFMSMLGISFLNDIIRKQEVTKASQVLNKLRDHVKTSLKQSGKRGESKDGMDMALCVINNNTKELQYSGAYNPLFIVRNGKLIEYKADRMPIGIYRKEKESFTNHIIDMKKDDKVYLFSDGFVDQLGGTNKEKYRIDNFKEFIISIHTLPLSAQRKKIEEEFVNWKKDNKQIDDIIILGVQI